MALFKKKEKSPALPGGSGGKSKLTVFLGIVVILAGGAYVYVNYLGPKPAPTPKRRVVKRRAKPKKKAKKATKPKAAPKKSAKAARKPAPKKAPAAPAKPTYEELLARIKQLEYQLKRQKGERMQSARMAPASASYAPSTSKKLPREYLRLRKVFRAVETDRYSGALMNRMSQVGPGSISFILPALKDEGIEQVIVTSHKGRREFTVVTDDESKLANRVTWSGGRWAFSRKDSRDRLDGVALPRVSVEDYLNAKEKYKKALDVLYNALSG